MTQTILLGLVVILIGMRLPAYFNRQEMSKRARIISIIMIYALLGAVLFATNFITGIIQIISSMVAA
jgi:hypothetical protein